MGKHNQKRPEPEFTDEFIASVRQSEEDIRAGRCKSFDNAEDADNWVEDLLKTGGNDCCLTGELYKKVK